MPTLDRPRIEYRTPVDLVRELRSGVLRIPLAEAAGADPGRAADRVAETVARLREVWAGEASAEASRLFPALAEHYERRLRGLPLTRD